MGRRPKEEIVFPEPEPTPPSIRRRRRAQIDAAATRLALAEVLTEAKLLSRADARSWRLGEEYLVAGAVVGLTTGEGQVTATVLGTQPYEVTLAATSRGNLGYEFLEMHLMQ